MNSFRAKFLFLTILVALLLGVGGCGRIETPTPTSIPPDPNALQTQIASSIYAPLTAESPHVTNTPTKSLVPTFTDTVQATKTFTPDFSSTPSNTPSLVPTTTSTPAAIPTLPEVTAIPTRVKASLLVLTPTPADWQTGDWVVLARILADTASKNRALMQQAKTLFSETSINCAQMVPILTALDNAPSYVEMGINFDPRLGRPGLEGRVFNLKDAYVDGMRRMRDDRLRALRDLCISGTQPSPDQKQWGTEWMDYPISKMEFVVNEINAELGP